MAAPVIPSVPQLGAQDTAPSSSAAAVTPNDSTVLALTRALWVGTGGNLKVTMGYGTDVTFTAVPDGKLMPIRVTKVFSTGTTASNIVAIY